jgi:hypothetical protein
MIINKHKNKKQIRLIINGLPAEKVNKEWEQDQ